MAKKGWLEKLGVKSADGGSRTGSDAQAEAHKSAPGANTGQSGGELSTPAASGKAAPGKVDAVRVEIVVGRADQDQISLTAEIPLSGAPVKLLEGCFSLRLIEFVSRDAEKAALERKAAGA